MMAGSVCLLSSRLLPGVGACFILMGTSEGLSTWTTRDIWSRTIRNQALKACGMLIGFSPARCISIRIIVTLGYEYHFFVAVIT
jgi:hypothetical protein